MSNANHAELRAPSSRRSVTATLAISLSLAIVITGCTISATSSSVSTDTAPSTSSRDSSADSTADSSADSTTSTAAPSSTSPDTTATGSSTTVPPAPSTTTAPPTTAPPADPRPLALDLLLTVTVENERPDGYVRDLFDHWITQPSGCSTREAVLIRDAIGEPQVDPFGCTVVEGDWISPYDGASWTYPSDIDIDHVVALKEAWDSGAWNWSEARRRAFANDLADPRSLRAVTDNVNQSKSDQDPSNWMPPLRSYWCTYLGDWVAIKVRWRLSMDQSEFGRIRNLLRDECPGWRIDRVTTATA